MAGLWQHLGTDDGKMQAENNGSAPKCHFKGSNHKCQKIMLVFFFFLGGAEGGVR